MISDAELYAIRCWEDLNRRQGRDERLARWRAQGWSESSCRQDRNGPIGAYAETQDHYFLGHGDPPYGSPPAKSKYRQQKAGAKPVEGTQQVRAGPEAPFLDRVLQGA